MQPLGQMRVFIGPRHQWHADGELRLTLPQRMSRRLPTIEHIGNCIGQGPHLRQLVGRHIARLRRRAAERKFVLVARKRERPTGRLFEGATEPRKGIDVVGRRHQRHGRIFDVNFQVVGNGPCHEGALRSGSRERKSLP